MLKDDFAKNSPNGRETPQNGKPKSPAGGTGPGSNAETEPLRFVAPSGGSVDVLKLLSDLEQQVKSCPRLMGALIKFDHDQFEMTLMKIRANLPEDMKRATKLVRDSEKIAEDARLKAEDITSSARTQAQQDVDKARSEIGMMRQLAQSEIAREREDFEREIQLQTRESLEAAKYTVQEAEEHAQKIISDTEIVRAAEIAARDIRNRADTEAAMTSEGANDYAASVLWDLQQALEKATAEIERGREVLEQRR